MTSLRGWKSQNERFAGPQPLHEIDAWMLQRQKDDEKERKRLDMSAKVSSGSKTILRREGITLCKSSKL